MVLKDYVRIFLYHIDIDEFYIYNDMNIYFVKYFFIFLFNYCECEDYVGHFFFLFSFLVRFNHDLAVWVIYAAYQMSFLWYCSSNRWAPRVLSWAARFLTNACTDWTGPLNLCGSFLKRPFQIPIYMVFTRSDQDFVWTLKETVTSEFVSAFLLRIVS